MKLSRKRITSAFRSAWNSLTQSSPRRALARQLIRLIRSPGTNSRRSANSSPSPLARETRLPVKSCVAPRETQLFTGNRVSRATGEGLEFADLREFVPGDRIRRINWRASARRGELWVNEFHAERNADVILFLDSFIDARRSDRGTLDEAVRAAATLTERYLLEKDRVGLVNFGGV